MRFEWPKIKSTRTDRPGGLSRALLTFSDGSELISLRLPARRVSTTAEEEKKRREENDARGQRLFSTSIFNVRPFFFWAASSSSTNRFAFAFFFPPLFKNFFSSSFAPSTLPMAFLLSPRRNFQLCARTRCRCFVSSGAAVTKAAKKKTSSSVEGTCRLKCRLLRQCRCHFRIWRCNHAELN